MATVGLNEEMMLNCMKYQNKICMQKKSGNCSDSGKGQSAPPLKG
jgi:hypothetical protein